MAALMRWLQRQFRQHMHPVLLAQRRVAQLRQRVRPGGEAPVQLPAEPCQPFPCLSVSSPAPARASAQAILKATATALRLQVLW